MPSQLSSLLESRKIEDLLAVAAEGNLPNAKIANVQGRNADIDTSAEDVTEIGGNYAPPTQARVHAIVSSSVEDGDDANAATGSIVIADYQEFAAVAATGSITYGTPLPTDTVEVAGTTFTCVAAAPAANEFSSIAELTALIQALATVNATDDGTTISIVAATAGTGGNAITLSVGGGNTGTLAVSGATLAGGEAVVTITVNGVAFVAGVDFTAATSNTATATSLRSAINASADVLIDGILTASGSTATITITADTAGTEGNSITLATSETDAATVSGANLTGGDDANTTGVLSVRITGVSATYAEIIEDVTLGGTVSVNTTNSFLRINKMEALTVGSAGAAVGNITATAATDGTVSAKIAAGENESRNAFYTVPLNKTGFVFAMFGEMYGAASTIIATAEMLMREYGKGWVSRGVCSVNGGEENTRRFAAPIAVPAKADIKIRAATSADNADLVAGMQMLVVADL
jgi:hypothetical protein